MPIVEKKPSLTVEQTAHLLKGSASNFAATEVVRCTQRLENSGRQGDLREAGKEYRDLEEALARFHTALEEWLAVHPI